jgi:hypothetical protein
VVRLDEPHGIVRPLSKHQHLAAERGRDRKVAADAVVGFEPRDRDEPLRDVADVVAEREGARICASDLGRRESLDLRERAPERDLDLQLVECALVAITEAPEGA